jgi:alkaline phosphatase
VDKQVPDSAGTATAMFCGVKTNYYTAGVDATATFSTCDPAVYEQAKIDSLLKWAQDDGRLTGKLKFRLQKFHIFCSNRFGNYD